MPKQAVFCLTIITAFLMAAFLTCGAPGCTSKQAVPADSSASLYCVLTELTGNIQLLQAGSNTWADAKLGMYLQAGDTINTGPNGTALLTFSDGSSVQLQINTELDLSELSANAQNGSTNISMAQLAGTTINRVAKLINTNSSYEISTPTGSAAVRGTEFTIQVLTDGTTATAVSEGTVWMTAQGVTVSIGANQASVVNPGSPPSSPEPAQSITYDLGLSYSQTLIAIGGPGPYSWSITSGALPAGLFLDTTTGIISGSPAAIGTTSVTLEVTDSSGGKASEALFITVDPAPSIITASLPDGALGVPYSQTLVVSGGASPFSWSVTSGALPAGLSLDATTGIISGSPSALGIFYVTFGVTDSAGGSAFEALSITINATPSTLSSLSP
jgi:hypothetical protein